MIGRWTKWNDTRRALAEELRAHGFDVWNKVSDRKGGRRRRKWYVCRRSEGINPLPMDMVEAERVMRIIHRHVPAAEQHSTNKLNVVVVWME